eukprot:gene34655-46517_t
MRSLCLHDNKRNWSPVSQPSQDSDTGDEEPGIAYTVEMGKSCGISWGSDLSFRWIYVMDIDPNGEAAGNVFKGIHLTFRDYIIGAGNTSLIGQDFDFVLSSLKSQPDSRFNYTFFRGRKELLTGGPAVLEPADMTLSVTVVQDGQKDRTLQCPGGTNLRKLLVGNGINVYRSITRWTNCSGKQRCGTCIVDVRDANEVYTASESAIV